MIRDSKGRLLLEKNTQGRLLGGFWAFPLIETKLVSQQLTLFEDSPIVLETMSQTTLFEERYGLMPIWSQATFPQVKHTFSHQKWTIELCEGFTDSMPLAPDRELVWVAIEDMAAYPMATPQKKMLEAYLKKQS